MKTDICCIGHITHDIIITPESESHLPGGTAFYFSKAINRLPRRLSFCAVTAMSPNDRAVVDQLRSEGIDVSLVEASDTVCFENRYGSSPDDRHQRVLAKSDPFTADSVAGVDAQVFHLGSILNDDFPLSLVEELSRRGRVSIDAQGFLRRVENGKVRACDWDDKLRFLSHTHYLKVNESEMEVLTGAHDPLDAALTIVGWGVPEVTITLGAAGSLILAEGEVYHVPAYKPRRLVDATGCGDTYSAGYLYKRLQGADPMEAGCFAAAMCTLKLEGSGPFCSSIEYVERVMK